MLRQETFPMAGDLERVSLADAIAALRKQIRTAAAQAQSLDPKERFRITEAELELTVVAEDTVGASAEVGWWVLKAKADISAKDATTHKVRLKLNLGDVEVGSPTKTA
jgi:hypothetical protein